MTSKDGGRASALNFRRMQPIGPLRRRYVQLRAVGLVSGLSAIAVLGGCSLSDGVGPYIADPGQFSVYHCKDLVNRLKAITEREKELRELMDKASEGGGGSVIGTLSYRPDYEKQLGDEKVLRRTAAEKKCALEPPAFESDQSIR
jgi:hypothetical protein